MRRVYEAIFIVNAALEDQDIESVIAKVTGYIENHGGKIEETNRWGRRRLAYPINKKYNGYYVHLIFETTASTIPILERFLILEDTILRHLTLQLPKKLRDYRQQRSLELGKPYDQAIFDRQESDKGKKDRSGGRRHQSHDRHGNDKKVNKETDKSEEKVESNKEEEKTESTEKE